MTFQELLDRSGMRMTEMAARFGIPYRTLQDWKSGVRKAPQYVINMMAELLDHDKEAENMPRKLWYALQSDSSDQWDNGTYDKDEALEWLKEQGRGLIAVIEEDPEGYNSVCIDEILYDDIV